MATNRKQTEAEKQAAAQRLPGETVEGFMLRTWTHEQWERYSRTFD